MPEARASVMTEGMQVTKAVSLVTPLSSGGMGEVWLADHSGLKTRVVVKFMLGGLDSNDGARMRFSREAAAAAQVKSPHVVQMLDHGVTDAGVPFIVMEHLEGHDLGDEIKTRGALEPAKVVVIVSQIAKALTKVHAAGLLHRDIKPDNIFLCDGEEDVFAKLLDFGIAKSSGVVQGDGPPMDSETKTGQIVGTPFYMSPEQVTAQKTIDHRSDLWALGVVAYEALTGTKPYDGPSFGALAVRIATGSPPKPCEVNTALPPSVDDWFAKACARNAAERFASAKEMAEALRAAFEGVVSLPARVSSGDSGQRSVNNTPIVSAQSGPRPTATEAEKIGFAATSPNSADTRPDRPPLGRSESGMAIAEDNAAPPASSLLKVGIPVGLAAVVATLFVYDYNARSQHDVSRPATVVSSSSAPQASVSAVPSAIVVAGPVTAVTSTATTGEPAVVDAGSTKPVTTTHVKTHVRPTAPSPAPPVVSAKPSAEPSAKPPPLPSDPLY